VQRRKERHVLGLIKAISPARLSGLAIRDDLAKRRAPIATGVGPQTHSQRQSEVPPESWRPDA
jgi:hypothetical protein